MSDLISREDAIHILACEMYAEAQSEGYDAESVEDYIPEATAWMSDAPSADTAEVVRCKECRHLYAENGCPLRTWHTHIEDDFCSYGERREP